MILDFGFNSSMIQISSEKVPRFVKNVPIGSSTFNRTLVQNLNLNLIQAEEYKKVYGMDPSVAEGKIYEYLKPLADSFILDIKRAIVYFIEKHKHMELTKIYLTGGLSKMPSFREYFAKNLNYPVEIFDLFSKVRVSSELNKYENELKGISPVIVTATGAAGVKIL
jgi:type IV pilus assembly protein PilM